MTDPDIVILRQNIHGMPADEYAAALRARLPDRSIVVARTPAAQRELATTAPVVTGVDIDEETLAGASNLKLFACTYAGTGHLPMETLRENGVAVTNAAGVHGPNIAEYVIGSLVLFARRFRRAWRQQDRREWRSFKSTELQGSTVTVVGLGAIGTTVVDRLDSFGVETLGVRYSPEKGGPTEAVFGFDEIHEALARTDYLVLACPLTDETRKLISTEEFHTLPPEAVLVNVARGPVVDTDALVSALRANGIGGAALDVTDPEPLPAAHALWGFENVQITPHNAGHTPKYYDRLSDVLAENLRRAEETGRWDGLTNQVA
ncbi:MAG: D-2-hydroxyacid dehydrogenase [Halobacteriota archaeon]